MKKKQKIRELNDIIKQIAALRNLPIDSQLAQEWRRNTAVTIERVFENDAGKHRNEFESFYRPVIIATSNSINVMQTYKRYLNSAEACLRSMIKEIETQKWPWLLICKYIIAFVAIFGGGTLTWHFVWNKTTYINTPQTNSGGNYSPSNTATGPNSFINNNYYLSGGENDLKETKLIDTYEQDTKINPNNIFTRIDLAHLYIKLKHYNDAIKVCNQAIRIDPNCTGAYDHLGFAYCKLGRWQKAIEAFKQAIKTDPCDAEAYGNLGVAYSKLGRYEEAVETFKRTIKLKPDSDETYNDWGRVLGDLVQKQEGIVCQQSLSEANEIFLRAESIKTGVGAYGLACVCALRNDKAGCQKWLEVSEQAGMLPMRKFVMDSNSLKSVFNEDWFLQIYWSDDPK